ncbi:MAG: TIGR02206 family membrane protein [Bacteroidia bacterium]
MSPFLAFNTNFRMYGTQHMVVILLILGLSIGLPLFSKRYLSAPQQVWISRAMAVVISSWVVLYDVILLYLGKVNYQTDLPLDICNLMGLLLLFLMWKPNKRFFSYLYFYILAGTTQAVFTPHLFDGFPNFVFIKYWVVHGGLIVYILYIAVVWGFGLTLKDVWRSFLVLQIYVLLVFMINKLIGANYVYVVAKPPTASILDYFGPWPVYLLVCEVIMLCISFMVYLPYRHAAPQK